MNKQIDHSVSSYSLPHLFYKFIGKADLMKKIDKLKSKKRELTLIIVITIVLTLFFTGYSIGKGLADTTIKAKAEVAEPILVVENGEHINIMGATNEGIYDFKVKNFDNEGKITQVNLEYTVEIISNTDESIVFKLYKNDNEVALENNKTKKMMLFTQGQQEDRYRLEILYDKTKSDSIADIIEDVQIKVHSEQVKV